MFLQTALDIQRCANEREAFDALVAGVRTHIPLRTAFRVDRKTAVVESGWNVKSSLSTELLDTAAHVLRAESFTLGSSLPVDAVNFPDCDMLVLPLRVQNEHVGSIVLIGDEGTFDHDLHSWNLLAEGVAMCEARADKAKQLQEEMDEQRRRAEESEALHTLGLATNRTLALDEVLDLVARFTRSLLGAHYAMVSTKGEDALTTVASIGLKAKMPARDGFAAHVIEANKPVTVTPSDAPTEILAVHKAEQMEVAVGIPLTLFGETFGALVVGYRREYHPTPRDIRLAMSVAQHASVAIANAKLHARVEERSEELASAYRQLEDLTHAKERFYNAISHDLRTPVGAIRGYSDLLLDGLGGELPPEAVKFVERTKRASEALLDLVNDLLDFAKLQAGHIKVKKRECNLTDIIEDAVNAVGPQASEKSLDLSIQNVNPMPILSTDPERARQILVNLLSNAVKFTERGTVAIEVAQADDWVDIMVRDTGPGIPLEYHEKIFIEFEQVPGSIGTGLGLPIARNLANLLGGNLTLHSEMGLGSTFTLRLPLVNSLTDVPFSEASPH